MNSLLRQSPIGRALRRLKWLLHSETASVDSGRLSIQLAPRLMEVGAHSDWTVRIENHSRRRWPSAGPNRVALVHRWITRTGIEQSPNCTPLAHSLLPGDWVDQKVAVLGLPAPGDYRLKWSLTLDGVPAEEREVPVTFPLSSDIDYHRVYASANLSENSWWVVGAYHSKEEFLRSSRERREMLITQGLTPDSRVLDIGCGTGQMAMALEDYLSDRGAYYGTDIGREGIEFCRQHYRRPNFVFETGGMTRVPFGSSAGPFDLAIFFSVFTHTHVDESMLLLAEAHRLLGPRGAVIADIITSDLVEREGGHRGQMWVNREHFQRLAEAVGYRVETIGTVMWAPEATRIMMRLSKAIAV